MVGVPGWHPLLLLALWRSPEIEVTKVTQRQVRASSRKVINNHWSAVAVGVAVGGVVMDKINTSFPREGGERWTWTLKNESCTARSHLYWWPFCGPTGSWVRFLIRRYFGILSLNVLLCSFPKCEYTKLNISIAICCKPPFALRWNRAFFAMQRNAMRCDAMQCTEVNSSPYKCSSILHFLPGKGTYDESSAKQPLMDEER